MLHYHITIIGKNLNSNTFVQNLKYQHNILLLEENTDTIIRYRNHIKTENGYLLILLKKKKNIQVTTNYFINLNIDEEREYAKNTFAQQHAS